MREGRTGGPRAEGPKGWPVGQKRGGKPSPIEPPSSQDSRLLPNSTGLTPGLFHSSQGTMCDSCEWPQLGLKNFPRNISRPRELVSEMVPQPMAGEPGMVARLSGTREGRNSRPDQRPPAFPSWLVCHPLHRTPPHPVGSQRMAPALPCPFLPQAS